MAINSSGGNTGSASMGPEEVELRVRLGALAEGLLEERAKEERKLGGVTPSGMQSLVGQFGECMNPNFSKYQVPTVINWHADEWTENINLGGRGSDERDIAVGLLQVAMQIAYLYAFDLYQAAYEKLDNTLQDAITLGNQAQRLVNKTAKRQEVAE